MITVITETELSFWLDFDGVRIYVGDDENPTAVLDIMELVRAEVMMYAIPATAESLDEIDVVKDDGGLKGLRDKLQEAVEYLDAALAK